MKIKPLFAWYDFWVGFFWDSKKRKLYVFPIPCVGLVIDVPKRGFWHIHFWREVSSAKIPGRKDRWCWLRSCRCGCVEYLAFATFGDDKWHDISDASGCMPWEHEQILSAARHYQLIPEADVDLCSVT